MKKTLPIILLFLCNYSFGQVPSYEKVFYDPSGPDLHVNAITRNNENNVLLLGDYNYSKQSIQLVDENGELVWSKAMEFDQSTNSNFNDGIATSDSCFLVVGKGYNSNSGKFDAFCTKINVLGDTLWTTGINSVVSVDMEAISIIETVDSTYAIIGNTASNSELFLAQLDRHGVLLSSQKMSAPGFIHVESIRQAQDSSYYLAGYYEPTIANRNGFIIHLDTAWQLDWAKQYENSSIKTIIPTPSGIFAHSIQPNQILHEVIKIDSSGTVNWKKKYSLSASDIYSTFAFVQLSDNSFAFLSGYENGGFVAIIDSNGEPISAHDLFLIAKDLIPTNEGGLFVAGNGPILGIKSSLISQEHIGLIKMDSLFSPSECSYSGWMVTPNIDLAIFADLSITVNSGIVQHAILVDYIDLDLSSQYGCISFFGALDENALSDLSVYPNASGGIFHFDQETLNRTISLFVFDSFGKIVHNQQLSGSTSQVDLTQLSGGIYFYKAIGSDSKMSTGKLMIAK